VIDYGGKDEYGCGAPNNAYTVRGSQGGFVIDRPKEEELDVAAQTGLQTAIAPEEAEKKSSIGALGGSARGR